MASVAVPDEASALVHDSKTKSLSIQTLPVPKRSGPEDHLVRIHAVAITNGELAWPEPLSLDTPIPGYELSGTVVSAPGDSPFPPGTDVYARTAFDRYGSARPFSIAKSQELGHKPANISWEEAATVPLSALTAWQALFIHGGLAAPSKDVDLTNIHQRNAAKRVLVTAAAGGVGIWAVQLASLAGAHVVGTCGAGNAQFVKDLGAVEVLGYKTTDLSKWINENPAGRKFDLALDAVGGESLTQCWCSVRDGETLVSIVMPPESNRPATGVGKDVSGVFFIVEANGNHLEEISALVEQGKCKTAFDSAFPFEEFEEAFKRAQGGHVRGKVVLKLQ
ncbi:Fc.00g096370.m01.CDS01 [Cosmosporella sp. VM-42]